MTTTKTHINIVNKYNRVIVLVDMDCFYCQVEEKLDPTLQGKPIAVVQYNAWQGGGIIAVNYAARAKGVTRHMRGDEAKEHCPEIELVKVPSVRDKADLTKYREAGKEVACVLQKFSPLLERASVDEAYLDITEKVLERLTAMNERKFQLEPQILLNTYAVGYDNIGSYVQKISSSTESGLDSDSQFLDEDDEMNEGIRNAYIKSDLKLLIGASIVNEMRAAVKKETTYECSAGIAHSKILAKLACGMNKPNKQTILPLNQIHDMYRTLPLSKVKGLGGKFGETVCRTLDIKFMADLVDFSERDLQKQFDEKNGTWLYLIARGVDLEAVVPRYTSKSIGCCKKFPGKNAINKLTTLNHWLLELAHEIDERLEKDLLENNRKAKLLTVSYMQTINGEDISSSRSVPFDSYNSEKMAKEALETIKRNTEKFLISDSDDNVLNNPLKFLGLSVSKFEKMPDGKKNSIQQMFNNQAKRNLENIDNNEKIQMVEENNDINLKIDDLKPVEENLEKQSSKVSFFQKHFAKKSPLALIAVNTMGSKSEQELESIPSCSKAAFGCLIVKNVSEINQSTENSFFNKSDKSDISDESNENPNDSFSHEPSTSNDNSNSIPIYKTTYVEYLRPQIPDEMYKTCPQCDKKITEFEYLSHMDFHFAYKLSQEQRFQYRINLKERSSELPKLIPPNGKKRRLDKSNPPTSNVTTIEQFLKKSQRHNSGAEKQELPSDHYEICKECDQAVSIDKVLEHFDFHAAKKLHRELNGRYETPELNLPAANKSLLVDDKRKKSATKTIANYFGQNSKI